MEAALFIVLVGLLFAPLRAEIWTTSDGKTYENVQVVSHNAAYVTILHENGGGRIPLGVLTPDLQKRFGYDPTKAAAIIATTQAADARDQAALAEERSCIQVQDIAEAQRMKEVADGIAATVFSPSSDSPPSRRIVASSPAIDSEPPTEIDDGDYSDAGGYAGYGYGYGAHGHGHRGGFGGQFGSRGTGHR